VVNGKDGEGSDTVIVVDSAISDTSENPVQNKIIKEYIDEILGDIDLALSTLVEVSD
jgi:hypothetical protein